MNKNCMNCKKSINREFGCEETYFQNYFDCDCELMTEAELDSVDRVGDTYADKCEYYEYDGTIDIMPVEIEEGNKKMEKTLEEVKNWKAPVPVSFEIAQAILEFADSEFQAVVICRNRQFFDVIKNRAIKIHKERQKRVGSICLLYLRWGGLEIRVN